MYLLKKLNIYIYRKEEGEKKYELYFTQLEALHNDICLRKKYFSHTY